MAQRTVIQLTDDLDGKPIPDGRGETIRFGLDRQDYEIDLAEKNAKALRDARGRAGRPTGGPSRDYDPKAVRAWAEAQGMEVSQRGRVPAELVAKFQEANA